MKLKIVYDPNPILRKRAQPVLLPLIEEDEKLLKMMLAYVRKSQDSDYAKKHNIREGVGLAAPQVGISKRLMVVSYPKGDNVVEYALANPMIISSSVKKVAMQSGEGCLSVEKQIPGYVYRSMKIKVKAFDLLTNQPIEIEARDYDAIVLQHEIDHLNGVLFYDYIDESNPFKVIENAEIL
jgi:peptide deformylase